MRVLIIGGGLGGLCLAQGLRRSGVDVTVYERDASAESRAQGYRISLNREGIQALYDCLPEPLFDLCALTSIRQATRMIFMDTRLRPKFAKPIPELELADGFGVNRRTLREILLSGLNVHFGKNFVSYEERDGSVVAEFADGSHAAGDLLVGADGTWSAVRAQLVPDAVIDELEAAVYGRTPLRADTFDWLPEELTDTFNRVLSDTAGLSVATCRARQQPSSAAAWLSDVADYLQWMVTPLPASLRAAEPAVLHAYAATVVAGWHPGVVRLIAEAELTATFPVVLTSARPVAPWTSPTVTLLGDAIHTMSPGRGEGANTALRDAALLSSLIASGVGLPTAKRQYEAEMLEYGFAAVDQSLSHPFAPRR